jgi:glycosyltransferase involved in cell wall biosynthesis
MMRPMRNERPGLRVAMVAACPFPSPRGSQVLIRELAQALAERGHRVHLVTYPFGESLTSIHGFSVHRVRAPRQFARSADRGWGKALLDLSIVAALYRLVRREHIDVIHAHNYEGPLIAFAVRALTGIPVVYHSHNALSDELEYYFAPGWQRSLARRAGRFLDRQVPRRADYSIALTPELEAFLREHGVSAERIVTIPPAVSPSALVELPACAPEAFTGRFVVMYAGNLDGYQDLDVLLDAFMMAQPAIGRALLAVITHDARWGERAGGRLARLVRTGVARVIVAPAFAVVRRLLATADVLVSPRSSWSGFPIKLINYMAAGRAIVAAEGSAKGLVSGETAVIVPNRDAHAFAAALVRLFCEPGLRQTLGDNARAAARAALTWPRVAAQVEEIYATLCGRPVDRTTAAESMAMGPLRASGARLSAASGTRRE